MGNIGDICNRKVAVTTRDTTVAAAAVLMREGHVGTLVIVDRLNGKRVPVGIVTDRDIVVEIVATGLDPGTITVGDIMVQELTTALEREGIPEAVEIMRYKGVRRLPIVTDDGALAGIVSIDDLLETLAEQMSDLTKIVAREQAHEARARK
jgi:CBS domain-containing protein